MRAAIALGSNLPSHFGEPAANLREALHRLVALGDVLAVSSFHVTAPVGYLDQPVFTNAAALLRTALSPGDLLRGLMATERSMGRMREGDLPPKGPRIIDLDLLLYEDEDGRSRSLQDPDLILPHPEMHRRAFVLEPLAEIAPNMLHPGQGRTVASLAKGIAAENEIPTSVESATH